MLHRFVIYLVAAVFATAALSDPATWRAEWPNTDFDRTSVETWSEIISGGPPRDGIPALSDPEFVRADASSGLDDREPVMTLELEGTAPRAYPIRYLTWHEIVNDTVAGTPIAVTFCPLCNSGLVFDRRIGGALRTFGVSGKLRNSDMVMYDRETESWWQQALGEGIVGHHTGDRLTPLPAWMESWESFRARNPDGLVMAEPDWNRRYGRNPYVSYDSSTRPFLYSGALPPHGIAPLARVVRVGDRAWPLERLANQGRIAEGGVVLELARGTGVGARHRADRRGARGGQRARPRRRRRERAPRRDVRLRLPCLLARRRMDA